MQFRNGIFIVIEENQCPLYNVGEELTVNDGTLLLPGSKPTCLTLATDLVKITSADSVYENLSDGKASRVRFECGGCTGVIRFEYKKKKGFATLQMKLLAAAEKREKARGVQAFVGLLRTIETFSILSDDDLLDLAGLLELMEYPWQFPITQKGDPGNRLFILLSGRAEVIDEQGIVLAEIQPGEFFGEMSLLTGERVTTTIMASEPSQLAVLNQKDFRHILNKFPALHVFFYKLLVNRITKMNEQRAEELASGLMGQLSDVSPVAVCQMLNFNRKTGRLQLEIGEDRGSVLFNDGELVAVDFNGKSGKEGMYEIIRMDSGRFKFVQGLSKDEKRLPVIGGFMSILMEAMKQLDEQR